MNVMKTMELNLKDVYQLLIGDLRYGYRRNNHLMPGCAYDRVKELIPQMYKVDKDYAVYTLRQICEECISDQLTWNFSDGEDDEFGNRLEALKFINWCLQWIHTNETDERYLGSMWFPYNYDQYLANIDKDSEPRYNIYEINGEDKILITPEALSEADYFKFIFDRLNATEGTYRNEVIKVNPEDYNDRRRHYIYHILTPVEKDFYVEHI